jgi:hypothetical protein
MIRHPVRTAEALGGAIKNRASAIWSGDTHAMGKTFTDIASMVVAPEADAAEGARLLEAADEAGLASKANLLEEESKIATATEDAGVRLTEDSEFSIEELREAGAIKPFSDFRVPQLPQASRAPTFANRLKAIQKARDLTKGEDILGLPNIDEFGVIIDEAGELRIGQGGQMGIELTNPKAQSWVGHTHVPGTGSMKPSLQDFLSIPSGGSEFFVDPLGRIHIIGRVGP